MTATTLWTGVSAREFVTFRYRDTFARQFRNKTRWFVATDPAGSLIGIAETEDLAWIAAAESLERMETMPFSRTQNSCGTVGKWSESTLRTVMEQWAVPPKSMAQNSHGTAMAGPMQENDLDTIRTPKKGCRDDRKEESGGRETRLITEPYSMNSKACSDSYKSLQRKEIARSDRARMGA